MTSCIMYNYMQEKLGLRGLNDSLYNVKTEKTF